MSSAVSPPTIDRRADAADLTAIEEGLRDSRRRPECECDHGSEEAYAPCGRRAKWRVTIDCVCGEEHPRTVEILCSRCLRTLRASHGREAITARSL
ncbi:MAG: hypothetical protein ACQEW8_11830 [Actinomycetota bacterium]